MYVSFIQIDFISLFLLSPQILIKLRKMRLRNSIAFDFFSLWYVRAANKTETYNKERVTTICC